MYLKDIASNREISRTLEGKQYSDYDFILMLGLEEFYNQCHDEDGKFCPTSGGVSGKAAAEKKSEGTGSGVADEAKRFAELFIGLPGQSSLRPHVFGKTSLKSFSLKELCRARTQFKTDAKNYRAARNTALLGVAAIPINTNRLTIAAISATRSAIVIGISSWRMKRINDQVERIDKRVSVLNKVKTKVKGSKVKAGIDSQVELQNDPVAEIPSLIEEIRKAQKMIDSGQVPKVDPPTKKEFLEAKEFVNSLKVDPEDGMTEPIVRAFKEVMEAAEQYYRDK